LNIPVALDELETAVLEACSTKAEWPAQIAAGIYAGIDFAIARPQLAMEMAVELPAEEPSGGYYDRLIGRLAGFIRINAPVHTRLPTSTDEAVVAGMVGLVGDHVRIGRLERLAVLRPELVLVTLLPYLGFEEAQRWANAAADRAP
jgi:hypothetical protein